MKKVMIATLLCALAATMTAQVRDQYWVQADSLCAKLLTMDTHNHIDVPMTKEKLPGPRIHSFTRCCPSARRCCSWNWGH